jgi:hypothetical protein
MSGNIDVLNNGKLFLYVFWSWFGRILVTTWTKGIRTSGAEKKAM